MSLQVTPISFRKLFQLASWVILNSESPEPVSPNAFGTEDLHM